MRTLDANAYLETLRELVAQGHTMSLVVTGSSMAPFLIHQRDRVFFRTPDRPLRAGDIVFYRRENGAFVVHRIHHIRRDGYYLIGDNQTELEGPLAREQIFALVTQVERKGKRLAPGDFWWEFFARVWLHGIPLRPLLHRLYPRKD